MEDLKKTKLKLLIPPFFIFTFEYMSWGYKLSTIVKGINEVGKKQNKKLLPKNFI